MMAAASAIRPGIRAPRGGAASDTPDSLGESLRLLDVALQSAIAELEATLGRDPSTAAFRGLYVTPDDAARLMAQPPGHSGWGRPVATDSHARFVPTGHTDTRLARTQRLFGLDAFETDALLLAASPDLDQRYERLYGLLQDDVTRRRPTLATISHLAAVRPAPQWQTWGRFFAPDSRLLRSGLARVIADPAQHLPTLGAHYLVAERQVVAFLAGHDALDADLAAFCDLSAAQAPAMFAATWARHAQEQDMFATHACFFGATAWERQHLAHAVASQQDLALLHMQLQGHDATEIQVTRALLAARLHEALLLVEAAPDTDVARLWRHLQHATGPSIVSVPHADDIGAAQRVQVRLPAAPERRACWQRRLAEAGWRTHADDIEEAAHGFALATDQIGAAVASIGPAGNNTRPLSRETLFAAARRPLALRLPSALVAIEPRARWQDLILADDATRQLHEICAHARSRALVLDTWGFGRASTRGYGLCVMFSGVSGTGKTTACEVLAQELGRSLLRLDLSQAISKYIGETEKQLAEVFDVAERSGAVLMFDEADALFGKRTDISDAHDRYANIAVSDLLQRVETFRGILVLTTNLQANMDAAFVRRLQFIVEFAAPDEEQRARIWRISLPDTAPLDPDLDCADLARRYAVAGGSIRNIAVAAAMLAAHQGDAVAMRHITQAARREYQKMGKSFPDAGYFAQGVAA